jgi:Tfp pilus assembly protein PilN
MGVDLNKEIKLSELFRRKAKEPKAGPPREEKPKEEKPRRALFQRAPKESKQPRPPQEKAAVAARSAPAVPTIPLMRAFNLLPREEPREAAARLGLAQVLIALLGLLLVAGLGSGYLFVNARVGSKQAEKDDLRVQLADLDVPVQDPGEAESDAARVTEGQARTAALAGALAGRVPWDRVLRKVTLVVPEDVFLTQVTAQTAGASAPATADAPADPAAAASASSSVTILGRAESQEAVARLLARLSVIPELSAVQLQSSAAETAEGGARLYAFTIAAGVGTPGATS